MLLLFLVYVLHNLCWAFTFFGFLLPPKYLIYYILFWPFILLHWTTNDNKCILQQIKNKLNGVDEEEPLIDNHSINLIRDSGVTFLWTIAVVRLFMHYDNL